MTRKTPIIDLDTLTGSQTEFQEIQFDSGRSVTAESAGNEDILEIREADGRMTVKIRLTEDGPVLSVEGARLELKSTESISMQARQVKIAGDEETIVKSDGSLRMSSSDNMEIDSKEDLRLNGKMIHIN